MILVAIGQRQDNRLLEGVELRTDRRGVSISGKGDVDRGAYALLLFLVVPRAPAGGAG